MQGPIRVEMPGGARTEPGRITLEGVRKVFQLRDSGSLEALRGVDLELAPGAFVSLVGPSGCGKSTLLKIVAGLIEPTAGHVEIDNAAVSGPRRSVGIMFQTPELFPWRSVIKNVLLPIEIFRHDREYHRKRALELLDLVGLSGFETSLPRELSGGMQQRVALSRVLVADPDIILMDEPFGALDEFTREKLNLELLRIWDESRKTVLFVTHNINEAVFLSDRVVVMGSQPGRVISVIDVGLPRPRTVEVMREPVYTDTVFEIRRLLGLGDR